MMFITSLKFSLDLRQEFTSQIEELIILIDQTVEEYYDERPLLQIMVEAAKATIDTLRITDKVTGKTSFTTNF